MTQSFLVVGADSLVGHGLISALEQRGHHVFGSTRRKENVNNKNRIFLDFQSKAPFVVPEGVDYVFIVAAATSYDRCDKDPLAYTINVELIPKLIQSLLAQNLFVTFISTNSVFGGEQPWPSEDAPHAPNIPYALQKSEAEKRIKANAAMLAAQDRLSIVRLTKILDVSTPPLPTWIEHWKAGKTVQPFSDLIFAPMSVSFVGQALAIIGEKRVSGDLHLSGSENIDYARFAYALIRHMGFPSKFVGKPTTAKEKGIHIAFKPTYSGLDMRRTTERTGVKPQPLEDVVVDLARQAKVN